ncbi:MAG: sigma-70 family RNA polymerase sigma factor [Bryobacteraceae bacterium]
MTDRRSDTGSFEAQAMPMFASLYNFAHWLTQNREEAEDLVQETYLKAFKGFASFQQGTNLRAWMYRILRNTFLTSRTGLSAKMTDPLDLDEGPAAMPVTSDTPESMLLARADQQAVLSALELLPVPFREVILLCDMEEMSYQEIAETLGIPIGTVMSRLSRARKSMRDLLAAKMHGASK